MPNVLIDTTRLHVAFADASADQTMLTTPLFESLEAQFE